MDKWNTNELSELHSPCETAWPRVVLTTDLSLGVIWESQHHFSTHNRPVGTLLTLLQEKELQEIIWACSLALFFFFLLVEITLLRNLTIFPVFSSSTSGWKIGLIQNSAPLFSRVPINVHLSWTSARNPTWSCQGCGFCLPWPPLAQGLGFVGLIGLHPLSRERMMKKKGHLSFFSVKLSCWSVLFGHREIKSSSANHLGLLLLEVLVLREETPRLSRANQALLSHCWSVEWK